MNKEEFNKLKEDKKLVVEVIQNGKVSNYWIDQHNNLLQLLGFLYNKNVIKANIKMRYSYNYSDYQTLTFSQSYENYDGTITTTKYVFYNIPTNLGYLDTYKIDKEVL